MQHSTHDGTWWMGAINSRRSLYTFRKFELKLEARRGIARSCFELAVASRCSQPICAQAFSSLCLNWRSLFMRPLKAESLILIVERQQEMRIEERLLKLEEFASDVRDFTKILTEMVRRHDERLDEHAEAIHEHSEMFREANRSIAALADAQIRTEDSLQKIVERLDRNGV